MTIDLTKIEKPFGLLDAETQEALTAHGGPYEYYTFGGWKGNSDPSWAEFTTYRVKPQPPKPREWWISGGTCAWDTKEEAFRYGGENVIHVREVVEGEE